VRDDVSAVIGSAPAQAASTRAAAASCPATGFFCVYADPGSSLYHRIGSVRNRTTCTAVLESDVSTAVAVFRPNTESNLSAAALDNKVDRLHFP
jgi:hypothetical protein